MMFNFSQEKQLLNDGMKDWIGNKQSTFLNLGASNHSGHDREEYDYYATQPEAINALFDVEEFSPIIWECACGQLHLSNRMKELGKEVYSTDIIDRTDGNIDKIQNFLLCSNLPKSQMDIITNPPYKYATEFVYKAMSLLEEGSKCAMFLKILFLESARRYELFKIYPPKTVAVFSKRMSCAMNGNFENAGSSAICYAWFIWEKGYKGETIIKWI